jgi:hypothetical protein
MPKDLKPIIKYTSRDFASIQRDIIQKHFETLAMPLLGP